MDERMEDEKLLYMEEPQGKLYVSMKKMKRKVKSKKKEFIGWGSKSLIDFLESIGKDINTQLSQFEVNVIIREYVYKNNLTHPVKKKNVLCDARLQSIFGRKCVNRNKIYDLLEAHLFENVEQSEEEDFRCSSEDTREDVSKSKACKRQRKSFSDRRPNKEEKVLETSWSCFASVKPKNIKLAYLKRSLVEHLLKNPETFEGKVMGSFVRVKSDPNDYSQRNSHQLLQVTGIKKVLRTADNSAEILLQLSNMKKDILICMLSDDDFSEEECKDLHQRVKDGLLKRPTIVELDQKARILHEDITNHRIDRELALLQNLIDRANEKGWRRELCEYLERRQLLQTPSERLRLLQEVPIVIAEELELESIPQDSHIDANQGKGDSPRTILVGALGNPTDDLAGHATMSALMIGRTDSAGDRALYYRESRKKEIGALVAEERLHHSGVCIQKQKQPHSDVFVPEEKQHKSDIFVSEDQSSVHHHSSAYIAEQQHQPIDLEEDSRETHLACVADKHQHHQIEVEEEISREVLLVCVAEQKNQPIEVEEESCRKMKLAGIAGQHQPIEVGEEISREVQLVCVAEQKNQPIEVEEESIRNMQLAGIAEQQHQPVDVEEESSKEMQLVCVAEQKNQLIEVEEESSRKMQLAGIAEQQHHPIDVEEESIRKVQLVCVADQKNQPREVEKECNRKIAGIAEQQHQAIEVEEEICRELQVAFVVEHHHQPIAVEKESSREMQLACVAEQQHQPIKNAEKSSEEMQLACVAEHQNQPIEVEEHAGSEACIVDLDETEGHWATVSRQGVSGVQFIDLSDDDEGLDIDRSPGDTTRNQNLNNPESSMWHYVDPFGDEHGPFSMSTLKRWRESNYFGPDFKVWKTGQSREAAILLTDALCWMFPQ